MRSKFRPTTLILTGLSCLLLNACASQQIPIDENMSQRKAAIATAEQFFESLKYKKFKQAMRLTSDPFWFDGDIVSRAELEAELRDEIEDIEDLKIVRARFYSKEDMAIFSRSTLRELKKNKQPHRYFVAMQIQEGDNRRPESVLFIMSYRQGKWVITGVDD